jgi:hypothetical protein
MVKSSTAAGILPKARSKAARAPSGSAVPPSADRSAGTSSVSTSRARLLVMAERRPKCHPRTVSATCSG